MKLEIFNIFSRILSDKYFAMLKIVYLHLRHGKIPRGFNFENPKTFNEKINFLKLYKKDKQGSIFADKCAVKDFIAENIGEKYLIPTIACYDTVEEFKNNFDMLPESFVIKITHGSGFNVIVKSKKDVNLGKIVATIEKWMSINYSQIGGEWQYNFRPRILIEEFISDFNEDLLDYKLFVFNNKVKYVQVDIDRYKEHKRNFYDIDWNLQPFTILYSQANKNIKKPQKLYEMIELAEKLSSFVNREFLRIDFYYINNKILFGEITFHPGGGCEFFIPYKYDIVLGKELKI